MTKFSIAIKDSNEISLHQTPSNDFPQKRRWCWWASLGRERQQR